MNKWLVLLGLVPSLTWAAICEDFLKRNADGSSVGVHRVESLKGVNTRLYDVSDYVRERRLPNDKRINIVKLDDVFAQGKTILGFGRPNVFLAFPQDVNGTGEWDKFSAKSFRRADSAIEKTRGFVQSGVLLAFPELQPEESERIYAAAKAHVGTRRVTCVNANCRVLSDAGFTIGGEDLNRYYMPGTLLRDILAYGLEIDGRSIEFEVVRVNPDFLETIGLGIDRAVGTTLCRHAERDCDGKEAANRATALVFLRKTGKHILNLFIGEPSSSRARAKLESVVVRLPDDVAVDANYEMQVSQPSGVGTLLRMLWGPHTLFELPLDAAQVARALPAVLKPFPNPNPSFVSRLKKSILFSQPVVSYLRWHLADNYRAFNNVSASNLYDMFRTDTPELPNRYNLVMLGDRVILMKMAIRNRVVDWILSKHLILSGYKDDVRFAGEVWKAADGKIHLNRNSGTYQPTPEQLELAAEILRQKFPGVDIVIDDEL